MCMTGNPPYVHTDCFYVWAVACLVRWKLVTCLFLGHYMNRDERIIGQNYFQTFDLDLCFWTWKCWTGLTLTHLTTKKTKLFQSCSIRTHFKHSSLLVFFYFQRKRSHWRTKFKWHCHNTQLLWHAKWQGSPLWSFLFPLLILIIIWHQTDDAIFSRVRAGSLPRNIDLSAWWR